MLPNDVKAHKDDKKLNQEILDPYLTEQQPTEHSKPYSDQAFKMAAIEWIITIDQVCWVLSYIQLFKSTLLLPSLISKKVKKRSSL
jgi:hypothetical protein